MTIRDFVNLDNTLIGLEATLYIEHNERSVERVVTNARRSLERSYGIIQESDINSLMAQSSSGNNSVEFFMKQILEQLKQLSLLITLTIYDRDFEVNLRDHEFLGFAEKDCIMALKYLESKKLYATKDKFYRTFINSADSLINCYAKRLIIIMAVFESLGIPEGVSIVSQFLRLSTEGRA